MNFLKRNIKYIIIAFVLLIISIHLTNNEDYISARKTYKSNIKVLEDIQNKNQSLTSEKSKLEKEIKTIIQN